ncbi:GNAT family N-acetyltransferase [Flavobacterium sp.]|jgi:ribosomal-protein-alanine N-acetyltransferase|uniref:GNAT family N-acetyltransferase n=2 Tax=Flavobacterium sp. TaxID=239 RepID=UPI0022C1B4C3|nr:GNAT family N-acetyltransferase [Flavobacterium sp.]MCZ8168974.1 GNAT family N-acetyltransferase [Flavobacterium sp.]
MIQRLETERLYMRPFKTADAADLFAMDNNPKVHIYLWQQPTLDQEESVKTIAYILEQYHRNQIGRFATFLKETDEFIGWTGIKFIDDHVENGHTNFYDYGYRLPEAYWGKGYATEATLKWLEFGFQTMNIPMMHAYAHRENGASNHILQKTGFIFQATYPDPAGVLWNWYAFNNPTLKP